MQNYHFFLNSRSILFLNSIDDIPKKQNRETSIFNVETDNQINYDRFFNKNEKSNWIIICGNKLEKKVAFFKKQFKLIKAAGGLVEAPDRTLLFIYRNGFWDLPKGKVEENENLITAARREVEEECGVNELCIENKLLETYHFYLQDGSYLLKETHWYKMHVPVKQKLTPQIEEGITKAEWLSKENISNILDRTYENIRMVLNWNYETNLSNSINSSAGDRGCKS